MITGLLLVQGKKIYAIEADKVTKEETLVNKEEKYGIMIGDAKGVYSWHDLNAGVLNSSTTLKITKNGTVMVPAWKLASFMSDVSYTYNKAKKQVTLKNKKNGRKIIATMNQDTITWFSSKTAKATTKKMKYRAYIAKGGTVMIPAEAFEYVMYRSGFRYVDATTMSGQGFDSVVYNGIYIYNASASVNEFVKATKVKGLSNTIKVTIPEGYSVAQTFELLVKKGVCESVDNLFTVCNEYDYSYYPLIKELEEKSERCFRLEGYLYPDTYEFYRLCPPQDAIGKFLRNSENKLTNEIKSMANERGMTINEVLILASLIEKEAGVYEEMTKISGVFHNRLQAGMRLQTDAASYYVERYIKPYISGDVNRFNSYYNTYKCAALPAGPICSPGRKAILAALNPDVSSALFFFSDDKGNYYYSDTFEQHLAKIEESKFH